VVVVVVVAVAGVAAIAGDNRGYLLGRRLGRRVLAREGRWQRHRRALLQRGDRFFARHGAKAVFIGRWPPVARVTSAWLAGASHMPWRTFAAFNGLGGIAWAASVGGAAYALGASGARVLAAAGAIATVIAVIVLSSRRRRRATAPAKPPTPSITTGGTHVPC